MPSHFRPDGTCDCPLDGRCFECGALCKDHDMVADYYWCNTCLIRSLDMYEAEHGKLDDWEAFNQADGSYK